MARNDSMPETSAASIAPAQGGNLMRVKDGKGRRSAPFGSTYKAATGCA
jgi:hypothetical protein